MFKDITTKRGDILSFYLTQANIDDRHEQVINFLTQHLTGKLFGDKGYISSKISEKLKKQGLKLVTNVRKNMKKVVLEENEKILLRKRSIIETINYQLKNISQIAHTRHRSINNFLLILYLL